MRIGVDCRLWNETGVGRYIRNLVLNLYEIDMENEYVLFVQGTDIESVKSQIQNSKSQANQKLEIRNFKLEIANVPWHGFKEQIEMPKILNNSKLDLVHFPYFSVPFFYYKPFIVTVHDLIVNHYNTGQASTLPYPIYFAKRIGYHAVLANAIYRSKKIIVPSNAVKEDLLKTYRNIDKSKVEVTYEGGFEDKIKDQRSKNKDKPIEGEYLLRVGNFYPHKNVEGLLEAFSRVVSSGNQNDSNIKLVLVGKKDYFYKRIENLRKRLNIDSRVVYLENVSDIELYNLYKNAAATIVPSFMEGFSLTAVEAMNSGSPVIVSDIAVHREICSNSVIYCNPRDINDITQKIHFALSLVESSRKELIDQGRKQAQKFSWKKMTEKTLRIYTSLR